MRDFPRDKLCNLWGQLTQLIFYIPKFQSTLIHSLHVAEDLACLIVDHAPALEHVRYLYDAPPDPADRPSGTLLQHLGSLDPGPPLKRLEINVYFDRYSDTLVTLLTRYGRALENVSVMSPYLYGWFGHHPHLAQLKALCPVLNQQVRYNMGRMALVGPWLYARLPQHEGDLDGWWTRWDNARGWAEPVEECSPL
ncbi:uncharacterized protein BO97DRAFT_428478 [Aspergillus homomorphus CBS 101889]|uniref:Uncharacterized protein n=1 Tax=Aspergillus homomorphus (strain CBS 101889) TaxID=1450537 RepID=A0A395HLI4_ASPHC|nr:hypothetical protein BO97DRAFT_428478 [Aspergillus homomorphus CBS 101889]RAL08339.1 hypothetical protein BO97DRAFT_428478 [Aspergillus homomorphus CBS 101889]